MPVPLPRPQARSAKMPSQDRQQTQDSSSRPLQQPLTASPIHESRDTQAGHLTDVAFDASIDDNEEQIQTMSTQLVMSSPASARVPQEHQQQLPRVTSQPQPQEVSGQAFKSDTVTRLPHPPISVSPPKYRSQSQTPHQTPQKPISKRGAAPNSSKPIVTPFQTSSASKSRPKSSQGTTDFTPKPSAPHPSAPRSAPSYRIPPAIVSSVSTSTKTKASGTQAPPLPLPRKHLLISQPHSFGNTLEDRAAALRSLGGKSALSKLFGPGNVRPPPALGLNVQTFQANSGRSAIDAGGVARRSNSASVVGGGVKSPQKGNATAEGAGLDTSSKSSPRPVHWSSRDNPKPGKELTRVLFKVTAPKATGRKRKRGTHDEFAFIGAENTDEMPLTSEQTTSKAAFENRKRCTDMERMRKAMWHNPSRVHAQPLTTVTEVHSFSCLPDFRYDPDEVHGMTDIILWKLRSGHESADMARWLFYGHDGGEAGVRADEKPALGFSQGTMPLAWGFKENMRAKGKGMDLDSP